MLRICSGTTEPDAQVAALIAAVQTNCHIADAQFAAHLPLCIYLLQMREFYRWEQGLALGAPLAREAIGPWLSQREALWDSLEGRDYAELPLPGGSAGLVAHAFEVERVNAVLTPRGLVYGAGFEGHGRPSFFLADHLGDQVVGGGLTVRRCGRELARCLASPPAALQGSTIALRREAFLRWMWEKYEGYSLRRPPGAFAELVKAYGLDQELLEGLARLVEAQEATLLLHECGEHRVGQGLGADWSALREHQSRRADLRLRALRDLLADLTHTLPSLLADDDANGLHFWFSGFEGVREQLFPALGAAYQAWRGGDHAVALRTCIAQGSGHFDALAEAVLALHRRQGPEAASAIEALLTDSTAVCVL